MVRTGATFADAAAEFLRYAADERDCKPSTLRDYRSIVEAHLVLRFGAERIEDITPAMIEAWRASFGPHLAARTKNKWLVVLHGIFRRAQTVWKLPINPVTGIEKHRQRSSGDIDVFSPEEVLALVRAAGDAQDAAIYFDCGVHGASPRRAARAAVARRRLRRPGDQGASQLCRRAGHVAEVRQGPTVPMAPDVATALAGLGQRERWTGDDDLVFVGTVGSHVDGSALRRRYIDTLQRAGLRPLRFHDLRHTFRDADDRQGRHPPRAGVDGPRRRADDDEVPALRTARRRRSARRRGLSHTAESRMHSSKLTR
jgi:integrase